MAEVSRLSHVPTPATIAATVFKKKLILFDFLPLRMRLAARDCEFHIFSTLEHLIELFGRDFCLVLGHSPAGQYEFFGQLVPCPTLAESIEIGQYIIQRMKISGLG